MNGQTTKIGADNPCLPPESKAQRRDLLRTVLPSVSRSFYLTLRVLPEAIRRQIGLAYLLARAADTIADTRIVPREQRLAALLRLRKQLGQEPAPGEIAEIQAMLLPHQSLAAEKILLENLAQCFILYRSVPPEDRTLIAEVVATLTRGMEFDLTRFPGESADQLTALDKPEELDQYTYSVAGCVGPFWTRMCMAHLPELKRWDSGKMEALGIRFGKGLQLCNVLRDIPKDLRIGRCYLPASELRELGLSPASLLNPAVHSELRPLYDRYMNAAVAHLVAGWEYTMSVPASLPRLRMACAWPIWIGLKTIAKLRQHPGILDPGRRIRISRAAVYGIMARSYWRRELDIGLNRYFQQLVKEAGV